MDVTSALIVLGAVLLLFGAVYFTARNEIVKVRLACPQRDTVADIDLKRRYEEPRKPVKVKSCNLLPDPANVDCGQDCIKNPN